MTFSTEVTVLDILFLLISFLKLSNCPTVNHFSQTTVLRYSLVLILYSLSDIFHFLYFQYTVKTLSSIFFILHLYNTFDQIKYTPSIISFRHSEIERRMQENFVVPRKGKKGRARTLHTLSLVILASPSLVSVPILGLRNFEFGMCNARIYPLTTRGSGR